MLNVYCSSVIYHFKWKMFGLCLKQTKKKWGIGVLIILGSIWKKLIASYSSWRFTDLHKDNNLAHYQRKASQLQLNCCGNLTCVWWQHNGNKVVVVAVRREKRTSVITDSNKLLLFLAKVWKANQKHPWTKFYCDMLFRLYGRNRTMLTPHH